jgi:hypothetical protein
MSNIVPTIGRIVNFRGSDGRVRAAIVTYVWSDICINLRAFGHDSDDKEDGSHTSVEMHEDGRASSWHWMPYQKGQAAKTEAVQAELDKTKA